MQKLQCWPTLLISFQKAINNSFALPRTENDNVHIRLFKYVAQLDMIDRKVAALANISTAALHFACWLENEFGIEELPDIPEDLDFRV